MSLVFGVTVADPATLGTVAALLTGVTLLLASGAVLGLIHVLAWIQLVAFLLGA